MSTGFDRDVRRRRDELVHRAHRCDSASELFEAVRGWLRRMVPFDVVLWMPTDPDTGLVSGPARAENLDPSHRGCVAYFRAEYFGGDVNAFGDLARSPVPAASLRASTYDHPARSARYRDWLAPQGLSDELRVALRIDGRAWGSMVLLREAGRKPFDAAETALIASLAGPLAGSLRTHSGPLPQPAVPVEPGGPGLMLFDPELNLVSANDDARGWLDRLPHGVTSQTPLGVELPSFVSSVLVRAHAVAEGRDPGPARVRLLTRNGCWLVCHASCLRDRDGAIGGIAVVLEPAAPAETAPMTAWALGLTPREQQIAALIGCGAGTAQIADELHLSRHTVRDHIKAIFEKAAVSTRGELVARLHAQPPRPSLT